MNCLRSSLTPGPSGCWGLVFSGGRSGLHKWDGLPPGRRGPDLPPVSGVKLRKVRHPLDPRGTRAWRKLRDQVVTEEPSCWLRIAGRCTHWSTTADHVIPFVQRPDLALERTNLRGACGPCNLARQDKALTELQRIDDAPALAFFH